MKYVYRLYDNDARVNVNCVTDIVAYIAEWTARYRATGGPLDNQFSTDDMGYGLVVILNRSDGLESIKSIVSNITSDHSVCIEIDGSDEELANCVVRYIAQFMIVNNLQVYGVVHIWNEHTRTSSTALVDSWYKGIIRPVNSYLLSYGTE